MNGKTSITIPVDLEDVRILKPGEDWAVQASVFDAAEVYVVTREGERVRVHAFGINADWVHIKAETA